MTYEVEQFPMSSFLRSAFSDSAGDQVSMKRIIGFLGFAALGCAMFVCLYGEDKTKLPDNIVDALLYITCMCILGTFKQPESLSRMLGGGSPSIKSTETTTIKKSDEVIS